MASTFKLCLFSTLALFLLNVMLVYYTNIYPMEPEISYVPKIFGKKQQADKETVKIRDLFETGFQDANPKICPDEGARLKFFIAVMSDPMNTHQRTTIRRTWGQFSSRSDVSIAFLLGSTNNIAINSLLEIEQHLNEDLIRFKFVDSHENSTFKVVSMLNWTKSFCKKARFLLKTDEDVFINVNRLFEQFNNFQRGKNAMFGKIVPAGEGRKPERNKKSKYYISVKEYPYDYFPDYLSGSAYLIPVDLSEKIYLTALDHSNFQMEDVLITGMIAEELDINHVHIPSFFNDYLDVHTCNAKFLLSIRNLSMGEQYELWNISNSPQENECYWVDLLNFRNLKMT